MKSADVTPVFEKENEQRKMIIDQLVYHQTF